MATISTKIWILLRIIKLIEMPLFIFYVPRSFYAYSHIQYKNGRSLNFYSRIYKHHIHNNILIFIFRPAIVYF
jgi:hypothetical protein